jgi:hypothetical protein
VKTRRLEILWDGAEVERLRQVRRAIERRCKTFEGLCAYLENLEKKGGRKYLRLPKAKSSAHASKLKIGTGKDPCRAR